MPGKVELLVPEARGLPVMDSQNDTTDAFVEVRYGSQTFKTRVAKHTLNPTWGPSGRFTIDVHDDALLQDVPLELRVFDHDTFSAHDIIGIVYVDLNPLLLGSGLNSGWSDSVTAAAAKQIVGWFPIYDTLRGVRGELRVEVSLEFFSNVSETQTDTSAGVQFFSSTFAPECFEVERVFGFVEELLVKDDPEHAALDVIRTARFTNAERQALLYQLSGEVRRQLGRKVVNVGGNAVLGYVKELDLEGNALVARGYGAAVRLSPRPSLYLLNSLLSPSDRHGHNAKPDLDIGGNQPVFSQLISLENSSKALPSFEELHQNDSERLSAAFSRPMLLTLVALDDNVRGLRVKRIGGLVMVRAVKRVDETNVVHRSFVNKDDDIQTTYGAKTVESESSQEAARGSWWHEVRDDIRSHCRFLGCNVVLGYTEQNTLLRKSGISILTGCGTAAVVEDTRAMHAVDTNGTGDVVLVADDEIVAHNDAMDTTVADKSDDTNSRHTITRTGRAGSVVTSSVCKCEATHLPTQFPRNGSGTDGKRNSEDTARKLSGSVCRLCNRHVVPDVLLATCEPPIDLHIDGEGVLIQARVVRVIKKFEGEQTAFKKEVTSHGFFDKMSMGFKSKSKKGTTHEQVKPKVRDRRTKKYQHILAVSEVLPFVQFDLHKQLLHKLRSMGKNAVFRLEFDLALSAGFVVCMATGTAVCLPSLPLPPRLSFGRERPEGRAVFEMQRLLTELSARNRLQHEHAVDSSLEPASISAQNRLICHFGLHWWARARSTYPARNSKPTQNSSAPRMRRRGRPRTEVSLQTPQGPILSRESDFIVQVTDELDSNLFTLYDPLPPPGYHICNTNVIVGAARPLQSSAQLVVAVRRARWLTSHENSSIPSDANHQLATMVQQMYATLYFRLRLLAPGVAITALRVLVQLPDDESVKLILTAAVSSTTPSVSIEADAATFFEQAANTVLSPLSLGSPMRSTDSDELGRFAVPSQSTVDLDDVVRDEFFFDTSVPPEMIPLPDADSASEIAADVLQPRQVGGDARRELVELSPMSHLPGAALLRYVGRIDLHLIREIREGQTFAQTHMAALCSMSLEPALGGRAPKGAFTHAFIQEIHSVVRAHVASLGGNVLLSYNLDEFAVSESKSQSYGLISISGDAFYAQRPGDADPDGVSTIIRNGCGAGLVQPSMSALSDFDVAELAGHVKVKLKSKRLGKQKKR